jgi:hypothetical protein
MSALFLANSTAAEANYKISIIKQKMKEII